MLKPFASSWPLTLRILLHYAHDVSRFVPAMQETDPEPLKPYAFRKRGLSGATTCDPPCFVRDLFCDSRRIGSTSAICECETKAPLPATQKAPGAGCMYRETE